MSTVDQAIIDRVRAALSAAGLDIKALAELTDVKYGTMQAYLLGKRLLPAAVIARIARALDVSCDWLLTGNPGSLHARSLLIAVDQLYRTIQARPTEEPCDHFGLMSQFYLTYKRQYLDRFRDPARAYVSSADAQADIAVLQKFREIAGGK